jgi:hypothetical protein
MSTKWAHYLSLYCSQFPTFCEKRHRVIARQLNCFNLGVRSRVRRLVVIVVRSSRIKDSVYTAHSPTSGRYATGTWLRQSGQSGTLGPHSTALACIQQQMSILDRLSACLNQRRGMRYCALCIARELGLSPTSVYEAVRPLVWLPRGELVRETGRCTACGKMRMVVYAKDG